MTATRRWSAAALLCMLAATPGAAQEIPRFGRPDSQLPQPFVLSISGGVSLGSYQAGVNWGLLELVRAVRNDSTFARGLNVRPYRLAAAAGASAGNINTLLWAIESCTLARGAPPESSLFYKFWVDVGLSDLLPERFRPDSSERGVLDRSFIRKTVYPLLTNRMKSRDIDPACDVPVGLTLTRIRPDTLPVDELNIETQRAATVFTVRAGTDAAGARRLLFTRPDREVAENRRFGKLVLLPADAEGKGVIDDEVVFSAVEASSAFPLAFQPKRLQVYHPDEGRIFTDWYMDGGVFDNNPVNLAVDLYAQSNEGRTTRRDSVRLAMHEPLRDVVTLVFVNPGRLRGKLLAERGSVAPPDVVPGGLRSVTQLLGGAVPTARQYELQIWARGQGLPGQDHLLMGERDTVAVRLTSRGHPIVGEHLGAFAGFLGRPFREYDFYVGVYDALHFAVKTYACATAPEGSDCIPRRLHHVIRNSGLPYGEIAPPVLDWLFRREFPAYAAEAPPAWPRDTAEAKRVRVLLALARANDTQYKVADPTLCRGANVPGQVLCRGGFLELLDAWKADTVPVRAIVRDWVRECRRSPGRDTTCAADEGLLKLIDDPVRFTANTIDLVLDRMQDVERAVQRDMLAGRRDSAVHIRSAEPIAEALTAFYRARPLRPVNGAEWNPSSVPGSLEYKRGAWAWIAGNLLPYRIAANLSDTGWEAGWLFAGHLGEHVSAIVPFTAGAARKYGDIPAGEGSYRGFGGVGGGLAFRGFLPTAASLVVPEAGVTGHHVWMLGDHPGAHRTWMGEAYVDFAALAGRLRLGVRRTSEPDVLHNGSWAISAGVADVNGFVYWMGKLLK